jgi:hypothetical protein
MTTSCNDKKYNKNAVSQYIYYDDEKMKGLNITIYKDDTALATGIIKEWVSNYDRNKTKIKGNWYSNMFGKIFQNYDIKLGKKKYLYNDFDTIQFNTCDNIDFNKLNEINDFMESQPINNLNQINDVMKSQSINNNGGGQNANRAENPTKRKPEDIAENLFAVVVKRIILFYS